MKTCTQCKLSKDEGQFYRHHTGKGGLHPWCKACLEVRRCRRRDAVRAQRRRDRRPTPLTTDQSRLIEQHIDVTRRCARRFARIMRGARFYTTLDYSDFLSAADEGIVLAALRFDPARGVPFEAYAVRGIFNSCGREIRRDRRVNGGVYDNAGGVVIRLWRVGMTDEASNR